MLSFQACGDTLGHEQGDLVEDCYGDQLDQIN
jgi:hypothetical protein